MSGCVTATEWTAGPDRGLRCPPASPPVPPQPHPHPVCASLHHREKQNAKIYFSRRDERPPSLPSLSLTPVLFVSLSFFFLFSPRPSPQQKAGGLGGVDIHASHRVRLQVERQRPLPHVHQHVAVRGRPAQLALRDHLGS